MPSAPRINRALAFAGAFAAAALLTACEGGGGGTGDPSIEANPAPLKVTWMSAQRREDWERNAPIEFRFSAPLHKDSLKAGIIERAIQISIVTADGKVRAKGSFRHPKDKFGEEIRDRLVFDPTKLHPDDTTQNNPFGFQPLTTYDVFIPTPHESTKFLTSTAKKPILETYESFFTTGERYLREVKQPRFTGIPNNTEDGSGALDFDPPRQFDGEVPYNARILLYFDEPMSPDSFELGSTIKIVNETLSTPTIDSIVPGTFQPDISAKVWKFVPSFSFGGAGYDIAVTLTTGIRDLSDNPIENPQTIRFRTEFAAGVPTVQVITENFDSQTKMDNVLTTAEWAAPQAGVLHGGAVTTDTTNVIISLADPNYAGGLRTRVRDHPFAQQGSTGVGRDQWIFTQSEVGASGAITAIGWGPSSNALYASDHTKVKVQLGHTQGQSLSLSMDNNFDVGAAVKVADSQYTIPQRASVDPPCSTDACAVGFWPLPTFTNVFEFNGKNNLILDVDASLGTNYQITRIYFGPAGFPNRNVFCDTGGNTGVLLQPLIPDMQFTKKRRTTIGQSTFYDSGQSNPNYSTPIVLPSTQSGGTSILIEYEGAKGILFPIPGNPNNIIPDPTSYTGFLGNTDQLDGYRFVRFRVTCVANVVTGDVPVVNSIAIPFIF
jgi:hypothetical protein